MTDCDTQSAIRYIDALDPADIAQVASYVSDLSQELADIAQRSRAPELAYLLRMAAEEAKQITLRLRAAARSTTLGLHTSSALSKTAHGSQ